MQGKRIKTYLKKGGPPVGLLLHERHSRLAYWGRQEGPRSFEGHCHPHRVQRNIFPSGTSIASPIGITRSTKSRHINTTGFEYKHCSPVVVETWKENFVVICTKHADAGPVTARERTNVKPKRKIHSEEALEREVVLPPVS